MEQNTEHIIQKRLECLKYGIHKDDIESLIKWVEYKNYDLKLVLQDLKNNMERAGGQLRVWCENIPTKKYFKPRGVIPNNFYKK